MLCSSCGAVNPSGSRFCMSCGTSLEATPEPISAPEPEPTSSPEPLTPVTTREPLERAGTVSVTLRPRRGAVITIDGREAAVEGVVKGAIKTMPVDGLDVGRDTKGEVGDYRGPFAYDGKIRSVVVELPE